MTTARIQRPASTPARKPPRPASQTRADAARRSCCPVAGTLDVIGDRWTLLVVRDLFAGKTRFADFLRSPERVATNILSNRLAQLVASGLVERRAAASGGHASYHLTPKGTTLGPLLVAVRDWGLANVAGTEARVAAEV